MVESYWQALGTWGNTHVHAASFLYIRYIIWESLWTWHSGQERFVSMMPPDAARFLLPGD